MINLATFLEMSASHLIECPVCSRSIHPSMINQHLDTACAIEPPSPVRTIEAPAAKRARSSPLRPLAERMRPDSLDTFIGQKHIIGEGSVLRRAIDEGFLPSLIMWGPPGTGKTTLARILARCVRNASFKALSAVTTGVPDVRKLIDRAAEGRRLNGQRTIFFLDECHRWNKAQQDALLPAVESGDVTFIGATTANPSFQMVSALLSRCRVLILNKLTDGEIEQVLVRAAKEGCEDIEIDGKAVHQMAVAADGDARLALNFLEIAVAAARARGPTSSIVPEDVPAVLQKNHLLSDREGEEHYNLISALHKSMRGSDTDAALYWLGRMLEGGQDPLYVARRLIRFASEDIGLADPQALVQAIAAKDAAHFVGMPECTVCLAQAVAYMSRAPKSNGLYVAYENVVQAIQEEATPPVPIHLRNAPTRLMKELGYGKGYLYNPDVPAELASKQEYLPSPLIGRRFVTKSLVDCERL